MSKQKTLAAFDFTKTIVHRGNVARVDIPLTVDLDVGTIPCRSCSKKFKTQQGLSVHLCVHVDQDRP